MVASASRGDQVQEQLTASTHTWAGAMLTLCRCSLMSAEPGEWQGRGWDSGKREEERVLSCLIYKHSIESYDDFWTVGITRQSSRVSHHVSGMTLVAMEQMTL